MSWEHYDYHLLHILIIIMQGYRQDHDYDEEYLQDEAGDRLRYGEDFDLDTTDTESTEHYDLD